MPGPFSQRLFSALQLTRMALVFTAIADALCSLMLWAEWRSGDADFLAYLGPSRIVAVIVVSSGLYGFGVSLNDIIDRRRDEQIASDRPLPSGRIGLIGAHVICAILFAAALLGSGWLIGQPGASALSLTLVLWTALLIAFYDFAGKYLVAPGLITLGLIRFFHATIFAPQLPLLWHPLLLLNHVTITAAVAYTWEQKRPRLTRLHWWAVLGGLGAVDSACVALVWWRRAAKHQIDFGQALWVTPGLIIPAAAVLVFVVVSVAIWMRRSDARSAGRIMMLVALLWLIVYDASFVAGYVSVIAGILILALLPMAYLSMLCMRWWARLQLLSQRPEFERAR